MSQNFLYEFEFVVDDLFITRPNNCAPEEYPVCCEISFRNSVFVTICNREYGQCIDITGPKCGKRCLFCLDSQVTDTDRLLIHVYKKKTDKCKFLIGCTDMAIKDIFDKAMESFNAENGNWEETLKKHIEKLPNRKQGKQGRPEIIDNDCTEDEMERREEMCPTAELTKHLLPLFNLKGRQTGNIVLIIRLVAKGPSIVTQFPTAFSNAGCVGKKPQKVRCGGGAGNYDEPQTSSKCPTKIYQKPSRPIKGCGSQKNPCEKFVKKQVCERYFACNADKGYPCDDIKDECDRAGYRNRGGNCPAAMPCTTAGSSKDPCSCAECVECCESGSKPDSKRTSCCQCTANDKPDEDHEICELSADDEQNSECDDDEESPPCKCIEPCFVEPRKPEPGPEAYDEFEACLNGSGLVIRVLKNTHQVENICDGTEVFSVNNSGSDDGECIDKNEKDSYNNNCCLSSMMQGSTFAANHIKRRTGGHIINHPNIPKIRANIKYSGNESCGMGDDDGENYNVPYSNIKKYCNDQRNKIQAYRSRRSTCGGEDFNENSCETQCQPPVHPNCNKSCCVQVNQDTIRKTMKGINVDTRKKGIEVCYKTCEDTESDVFLVKLGSKQKCQRKKNNIEIELKTPKQPIVLPTRHVTTETQIDEEELDAALAGVRNKKGKKNKNKQNRQSK